jgi:Flp pilus assembly protein TadG
MLMQSQHADLPKRRSQRILARLAKLRRANSGVAALEFGLILPMLSFFGMYGTELAYLAIVNSEISQMAISVADNASRLGQTDNSAVTPTITEANINSIMFGAMKQGAGISFQTKGRVILSSLELDAYSGKQYIHWQRCRGNLTTAVSAYGTQVAGANGLTGPVLSGMGSTGHKITAPAGSAVMYVEVSFTYTGLFGTMFVANKTIKQEAAFLVRDGRNLTPGITGTGGQSNC